MDVVTSTKGKINMCTGLVYKLIAFLQIIQAINGIISANNTDSQIKQNYSSTLIYLTSADCAAYESITSTDEKTHQYIPYFVKLHRCLGADTQHTPTHRTCMPVATHTVNISVFERGDTTKVISIMLKNHTKCEYKCTKDSSICSEYEYWDGDSCQCRCNIATKAKCTWPTRVWDNTTCCTCRNTDECHNDGGVIDSTDCHCIQKHDTCVTPVVDKDKSTTCKEDADLLTVGSVVVIVFLENLVVVVAGLLVYYWWGRRRHNAGTCSQDNQVYLSATCLVESNEKQTKNEKDEEQGWNI